MRLGLEHYINHNMVPVELATDSLTFKKIIEGTWEVPWSITMEIKRIKFLMTSYTVMIMQTFNTEGSK